MKRMSENWRVRYAIVCLLVFVGLGSTLPSYSQSNQKVKISGTVYEYDANNKRVPLGFATVSIPDAALGTTSNDRGKYELPNVPVGKVRLSIQYLGKVSIDTLVNVTKDMALNFTLQNEDFRLKEVTVTATNSRAGKSTASQISRQAMDHMQANSLFDLMSMLPGGISQNQDLSKSQQINLRMVTSTNNTDPDNAFNALGTSVIRDGAPISNNANLSSHNTTLAGKGTAIGGGASATGGADVRSISTENIESVEIIRGIPSVEYGDLTSGAVIINSKAGREPLRVKAKANPNIYQVSVGSGYELGEKKGALNFSADYAHSTAEVAASYKKYQRATAKLLYSNVFFNNKLRSNTSLDFIYGKDTHDPNPDDYLNYEASSGKDVGFTFNTNGTWNINKGWLQTVKYVVSGTYTDKQSHMEALATGDYPFSKTFTDGAVLGNVAGERIYDAFGNEITNFTGGDVLNYAYRLPSNYVTNYDIDSREVNVFAKLTATLFKQSGDVSNRILLGADFKSDGNVGEGKTFGENTPPFKNNQYDNSTYRPRSYKDIPFINQFGAYVEDNFKWNLCGSNELNIQAGVRFDHTSVVGSIITPRVNASLEFIPNTLTFFGGYGVTAKMPTLIHLYPENAYFEYVNLNELDDTNIPEADRKFITTTRVFEVNNSDLEIAKNHKAEIGFNLKLGKAQLNVTGFHERLKNGYSLAKTLDTYKSVNWTMYSRNENGGLVGTDYNVLSYFNSPTNNLNVETKGVEFDLNFGRIDAIRTAFQLNGAWMRTKTWSKGYDFYDNSNEAPETRNPIAIMDGKDTSYRQKFVTTVRATHNIPSIGFVVTLTGQAIWQNTNWTTYGSAIPLGYIALNGDVNWFEKDRFATVDDLKASEFAYMWENKNYSDAIKQSYNPYFCFNLNVTKEISDMMRVSFFANNMFRYYSIQDNKREPGKYKALNDQFFFGLELSLTL